MDDTIILARDDTTLEKVQQEPRDNGYNFNRDSDFKSYLGVQLDTLKDGSLKLSQPHLAKSLLDVTGMSEGAATCTPSSDPLFCHAESKPFATIVSKYVMGT